MLCWILEAVTSRIAHGRLFMCICKKCRDRLDSLDNRSRDTNKDRDGDGDGDKGGDRGGDKDVISERMRRETHCFRARAHRLRLMKETRRSHDKNSSQCHCESE